MMKKILHLPILIALLFIFVFTIGCERDAIENERQTNNILDIQWYAINAQEIYAENINLKKFIDEHFENQSLSVLRRKGENYNFSIKEEYIQLLSTDRYKSYTYLIENEALFYNESLKNYIITQYPNGLYTQMIIEYPVIYVDGLKKYDLINAVVTNIKEESILNTRNSPCPVYLEIVEWDENGGVCIDYDCTAGGEHQPGEQCNGEADQQPYTECSGAWVVVGCYDSGGYGGSTQSGDDNPEIGGGNPINIDQIPSNNPPEYIPVIPLDFPITTQLEFELFQIMEPGDSYQFDDTITPPIQFQFNSVNEFETYLSLVESNNVIESSTVSSLGNGHISNLKFKIPWTLTYFNADILSELETNTSSYRYISTNSYLTGITTLFDWTQTAAASSMLIGYDDFVFITIQGAHSFGISIDGHGLTYVKSSTIVIKLNKITGQIISFGYN